MYTSIKGFSLNKMGVDFLVTGLKWAYFAFVVRIVGRKKSRSLYTGCTRVSKASFSLNKMGVDFPVIGL